MIYQKHPNHGRHFPQNIQEANENEKNGWVTVTEDEFYNIKPVIKEDIPENKVTSKKKK